MSVFGILPKLTVDVLPNLALHGRLSVTREVVLSGFQLDMYTAEEKAMAYWYVGQVLAVHVECLASLLSAVLRGMKFASIFLHLLIAETFKMVSQNKN